MLEEGSIAPQQERARQALAAVNGEPASSLSPPFASFLLSVAGTWGAAKPRANPEPSR